MSIQMVATHQFMTGISSIKGISPCVAVWGSRNIPAVKTLAAVGLDKSQAFLENLGIKYPNSNIQMPSQVTILVKGSQFGASSEKWLLPMRRLVRVAFIRHLTMSLKLLMQRKQS